MGSRVATRLQGRNMKQNPFVGAALAVVALLASPTTANAVSPQDAASSSVSEASEQATVFLAAYDVDRPTIDRLIAKWESGEKWDSLSSESTPVSEHTQRTFGFDETVRRYADGSVAVTRVEVPAAPTAMAPFSTVHSCSVSGNMRNDCQADMWVGLVSMGFRMSYNASTNTVTNVYGGTWSIGGACASSQKYLGKPASNVARLEVQASMCGLPYTTTFWLQATVSGGVANESWSA